ncbi:tRNA pseudouridine synthase A family protein [Babesia divergens]|uniref:tRNA pseudouridine synthase n=1 Tax=Babesia divergens TaxID=32595 RepID=A0AAD9LEK5_BABDI|nr:tRNA pseudouridine synthase A family protein [Babesia divergens]
MSVAENASGPCGSKILVDFSYIGTGFHPNTVESQLFTAFAKASMAANVLNKFVLMYHNRMHSSGYERCGRTDKDVHALHNYCSFFLDPCSPEDHCMRSSDREHGSGVCYRIKSFVKAVNKHLPRSIRINSVDAVPDNFSARRCCVSRTYKYFFKLGTMNLSSMQEASQEFVGCRVNSKTHVVQVGSHNFLQFCKMDSRNPKGPNTTIYSFTIEHYNDILSVATIIGRSFLWHQVRCMVGMLFLVGNGTISGVTIKELLEHPQGPKYNYKMASPHGLVLADCSYEIQLEPRRLSSHAVYREELEHSIQRLGPLSLLATNE